MFGAKVVCCNDSGLAHLAGLLGVPTVVIGHNGEKIFGCYPSVQTLPMTATPAEVCGLITL